MLVTTRWEELRNKARGEETEKQLTTTDNFWELMIKGGCKIGRHNDTKESALKLIGNFVHTRDEPELVLDIQKEIVDQGKTLLATSAGQEVDNRFAQDLRLAKEEVDDVKRSMIEALKESDKTWIQELERQRKAASAHEEKTKAEYETMRRTMQERYEDSCRRLQAELDELRLESVSHKSKTKAYSSPSNFIMQRPVTTSKEFVATSSVSVEYSRAYRDKRLPDLDSMIQTLKSACARKLTQASGAVLSENDTIWLCRQNSELFMSQSMLLEIKPPVIVSRFRRGMRDATCL